MIKKSKDLFNKKISSDRRKILCSIITEKKHKKMGFLKFRKIQFINQVHNKLKLESLPSKNKTETSFIPSLTTPK